MKLHTLLMISVMLFSLAPAALAEEMNIPEDWRRTIEDATDKSADELEEDRKLAQQAYAAASDEECLSIFKEAGTDRSDEHILEACSRFRSASQEDDEPEMNFGGKLERLYREHREEGTESMLRELSREQIEKLEGLTREQIEEYLSMDRDQLQQRIEALKVERVKVEDLYRKRVVAQERMELAKEKYLQAKERYQELKEKYNDRRDEWRKAVEEGREEDAIEAAKKQTLRAAEMILETIEQTKAKIEENDDLTEVEAEEALLKLEEKKEVIEAVIEEIEAAQTKEEIKTAAGKLKNAWERSRYQIKEKAEEAVKAQVGEILTRSQRLEIKMDRILAELEESGEEVDSLESKVETFSTKIEEAKELYAEGKGYLEQAKESEDEELFTKGKEKIREAHQKLKEANQTLMELWKDIKETGYEGELEEEEDEEVEVVVDEEEEEDKEHSLRVCDHNEDGVRNLQDVVLFARMKETFDANGDGMHDIRDVSLYAKPENHLDNDWCKEIEVVEEEEEEEDETDDEEYEELGYVGSACGYEDYDATCTITRIEAVETAAVEGGMAYQGYEITYSLAVEDDIEEYEAQWHKEAIEDLAEEEFSLRMKNSWHLSQAFMEEYSIKEEAVFSCELKLQTQGTCTPQIIEFEDIDTSDYDAVKGEDDEKEEDYEMEDS